MDKIPKETLESMKQFFLKTSVPRIVEKELGENEHKSKSMEQSDVKTKTSTT